MATSKKINSISPIKTEVGRGRPVSGKTRSQIETESARKYEENKRKAGLERITPFVKLETKNDLSTLKTSLNVSTIGDVIDQLVEEKIKKLKKTK